MRLRWKNTLQIIKFITLPSSRQNGIFKIQLFPNLTNRKMSVKWTYLFYEKKVFYYEKSTLVLLFSSLRPFKKSFFFSFLLLLSLQNHSMNGKQNDTELKVLFIFYYILLTTMTQHYIEWIENKVGKRECFCARY